MEENKIKNCIVKIKTNNAHGTGFFIETNKILTCFHVIKDTAEGDIKVLFKDDEYSVEVLDKKENIDLAILKVEIDSNSFLELANIGSIEINKIFQAYGFGDDEDLKRGLVPLTFEYEGTTDNLMKFKNGQFEEGHSGSPILDLDTKKVIGVLNISRNTATNLGGYGIAIDKLELLEKIEKNTREIKIDAINILKIAILGKRDFKKLSKDEGVKNIEGIHYEYFYYSDRNIKKGYIFLGNKITNRDIFPNIKKKVKKDEIKHLEIFLAKVKKSNGNVVNKKTSIEKYLSQNFLVKIVNKNIHYIDDVIWECTIDNNLNSNDVYQREDFIDQIVYTNNNESKGLSLDFFKQEINNQDIPISIIYGSGGVGKTTFCDALKYSINQNKDIRKKVFYIKGEKIVDILSEINQGLYEINSLNDLYSLYKEENDFLDFDEEIFRLNYISGNIVVIIDAIEEIASALGDRFKIESFFTSLHELNENFFSTKVIITTREPFYIKIKEILFDNNIQYLNLLGFTSNDLDNFLRKKYDTTNERNKVKDFIKNNSLFDKSEDSHIIPLFVDWVCKIIDRPETSKNIKSKYFLENIDIDKLLIKLINREIEKQSLSVNIDDIFNFLEEIIIENNGTISRNYFSEYIQVVIGSDEKVDNYIHNPLFINEKNSIKIKYDILTDFIKARSLRYKILNNQSTTRKLLKICYDGKSELYQLVIKVLEKENCLSNFKYQIKYLKDLIEKDNFENSLEKENTKKSISAILYLSCQLLIQKQEKLEYMTLLKELYNTEKSISSLFIYGDFYPLDFKDLIVRKSEFIEYMNFRKCIFPKSSDKPTFYDTQFRDINIPNSNTINSKLFKDCKYVNSNIEEIIIKTDNKEEEKRKKIYKNIVAVCKKIGESQKLLKIFENEKTISINIKPQIFLQKLVNIGLLKKIESMYRIEKKYYSELPDIKLGDFPPELKEKIDEIFFTS